MIKEVSTIKDKDEKSPLTSFFENIENNGGEKSAIEVTKILFNKTDINQSEIANIQDYNGSTVLMYVCEKGYVDLVILLLHNGAAVDKKNKENKTALQITQEKKDKVSKNEQKNYQKIIDFLESFDKNLLTIVVQLMQTLKLKLIHLLTEVHNLSSTK